MTRWYRVEELIARDSRIPGCFDQSASEIERGRERKREREREGYRVERRAPVTDAGANGASQKKSDSRKDISRKLRGDLTVR